MKIKRQRPQRMARVRRAQLRRAVAAARSPATSPAAPADPLVAEPLTPIASAPTQDADETIRWTYTPEEWAWFDGWAQRQFWRESLMVGVDFIVTLALVLLFMAVPPDSLLVVLLIYVPLVVIWAWQGYRRLQDHRLRYRLYNERRQARRQGPRQITVRDTAIWEAGQRLPLGRPYSILRSLNVVQKPPGQCLLRFEGVHGAHRSTRFTIWVPVPRGQEAMAEAVALPFLREEVQP
jgi:hypothetical protein